MEKINKKTLQGHENSFRFNNFTMPLPWLKRYRHHIACWRYWPFIFFGIGPIPNLAVSQHCHSAFIYIYSARSCSTYADGKDKIAITHQPWTRWYQGFGIAELWTLQSAVSYLSDNWVMNGPPPADVLRRWKPLMWDSHRASLFSAIWLLLCFPVGYRRQSDKPAQPRHGLPRSVMEVGTTRSTQCEYQSATSGPVSKPVFLVSRSIGGDKTLDSVTTLPSEFGTFDFKRMPEYSRSVLK